MTPCEKFGRKIGGGFELGGGYTNYRRADGKTGTYIHLDCIAPTKDKPKMTDKILEAVKALGGDLRNACNIPSAEGYNYLSHENNGNHLILLDEALCYNYICTISEFNTYAEQWLKEAYMHNAALDLGWDINNAWYDGEPNLHYYTDGRTPREIWATHNVQKKEFICTTQEFIDYCNANKPCKEVKPVFTQEMADAGELPPVGSFCMHTGFMNDFENTCHFKDGDIVEVLSLYTSEKTGSKGVVFARDSVDSPDCGWSSNSRHFKPIQSPRDKAIDAMESQLKAHHWSQEEVCIAIYDWLKQLTPEQRKEFGL